MDKCVLAKLKHLENDLQLLLNGRQIFLGNQWGVAQKTEDSMTNEL